MHNIHGNHLISHDFSLLERECCLVTTTMHYSSPINIFACPSWLKYYNIIVSVLLILMK